MSLKFIEERIKTRSGANRFNFFSSMLLWSFLVILSLLILNSGLNNQVGSIVCLVISVVFLVIIFKVSIRKYYKSKIVFIFCSLLVPFFAYFIGILVFLWESTSFNDVKIL
jgi:hypothetical protein